MKRNFAEGKNLKKRIWRLKELEKEAADTKAMNRDETKKAKDYEDFLNDLEADPEMRTHMNLYRNEQAIKEKNQTQMIDESEEGKGKKKKQKKKLKVKKSKKNTKAAAGGQENDDKDPNKKEGDGEDKKDNDKKEEKDDDDDEEDDPMVKVEELLADLNLEDQGALEDNDDAIDDFINRLGKIKIEGKN